MIPEKQLARWAGIGVKPTEILLPGEKVEEEKWSVIACDQFSSEPEYWDEVTKLVGRDWSTLNLIIPECNLGREEPPRQAERVHQQMDRVLEAEVLRSLPKGFVLVERELSGGAKRLGLVLTVDLEAYSFDEGAKSLIRPTEGTIVERLPPRMDVRRGAGLDLPHVLLLIDDPQNIVMDAAQATISSEVYNFHLMKGGGRVRGWSVQPEEGLLAAFEALAARGDFLFAVGDGNHSLAAARQVWRENKSRGVHPDNPSRYALVEVENIHQPAVTFHPIHRVLFHGGDFSDLFDFPDKVEGLSVRSVQKLAGGELEEFLRRTVSDQPHKSVEESKGLVHFIVQDGTGYSWYQLDVELNQGRLAVELLQPLLDNYLEKHEGIELDYIHGEDSVLSILRSSEGAAGLILPDLDKGDFFGRMARVGPYPRKAFSIGHAEEKRYYLEARRMKTGR